MIEHFAQPLLVEVAGEIVVIRQELEPLLLRLAGGDEPHDAAQPLGPADVVELGGAAIVQPAEAAALKPHAIFAIERQAARVMRMELLLALKQIVGIDALGESLAAREFHALIEAEHLQRAVPDNDIAVDVPDIGDVARGSERGENISQFRIHFDAEGVRRAGRCLRQLSHAKRVPRTKATRGAQ